MFTCAKCSLYRVGKAQLPVLKLLFKFIVGMNVFHLSLKDDDRRYSIPSGSEVFFFFLSTIHIPKLPFKVV